MRRVILLWAIALIIPAAPQVVEAQALLPPLGITGLRNTGLNAQPSPIGASGTYPVSAQDTRRRRWPWYSLGGAVVGAAAVGVFAVANCDEGCRDDGAMAYLPPFILAGALAGALVGAVVGLMADRN